MKLLARIGLADKASTYPSKLSGGQKQRIAIVRSLAMNPDLMLFDEPTSGLDYAHMAQTATLLRELAASGAFVLVVTHDFELALAACDRVTEMKGGKVTAQYGLDKGGVARLREFFGIG